MEYISNEKLYRVQSYVCSRVKSFALNHWKAVLICAWLVQPISDKASLGTQICVNR
jgi:hypothetical protein